MLEQARARHRRLARADLAAGSLILASVRRVMTVDAMETSRKSGRSSCRTCTAPSVRRVVHDRGDIDESEIELSMRCRARVAPLYVASSSKATLPATTITRAATRCSPGPRPRGWRSSRKPSSIRLAGQNPGAREPRHRDMSCHYRTLEPQAQRHESLHRALRHFLQGRGIKVRDGAKSRIPVAGSRSPRLWIATPHDTHRPYVEGPGMRAGQQPNRERSDHHPTRPMGHAALT